MARIRTIKPEFWDSPGTARASLEARLFFISLWNWADDYGIGTANPKQLMGFAFPNDANFTVKEFPRIRDEVSDCYEVQWYEVGGRHYFAIPSWDTHQKTERRANRKNPAPDQADLPSSEMQGSSARTRGDSGVGTGEQGNRGTGEQSSSSEVADATPRPEIIRLLDLLDAEIINNGGKAPSRTKRNLDAARLLLDRDGKTPDQVEAAIRWCQADEFWRSNILSMSKLREKYDQLALAAKRNAPKGTASATPKPEDIRDGFLFENGRPVRGGPRGMSREQYQAWQDKQEEERG